MDNSEPLQTPTSVRFDEETTERIKTLAAAEKRSFSNMVRVLVAEALALRITGLPDGAQRAQRVAA